MLLTKLHRNGDIVDYFPGNYNIDLKNASNLGNMTKNFYMNWRTYRKISGAACELWDQRKYKPIFVTLTSKDPLPDEKSNYLLSNYLKNLRTHYSLSGYIWVKEYQSRGAVHFHTVLDIPFRDIRDYNSIWCNTIRDYSRPSNNALQLSPEWGGVVKSRSKVVRYVCKYISKYAKGRGNRTRIYGCSGHLVKHPLVLDEITKEEILNKYWRGTFKHEYGSIYFTKSTANIYTRIEKHSRQ